MASSFGHAILGYTIAKVGKTNSKLLMTLAIISSFLPDADVLLHYQGVPYGSMWGHRGFTHSIVFALLWSGLLLLVFKKIRQWSSFLVLFFSTVSHGIIDAMTTGGKGIGFFIPFTDERYFLPDAFRQIKVSPMSIKRFFADWEWGKSVLMSEFVWIFIPCITILILLKYLSYGNK